MPQLICTGCNTDVPVGMPCANCTPAKPIVVKNGSQLTGTNETYTVQRLLSLKGGTAVIYKADCATFGDVIVKELLDDPDPTAKADNEIRFEREINILSSLTHPNLPKGYDRFDDQGHKFLVEKFIEGQDLGDIVKKSGPFGHDEALLIGIEVADTLTVIHTQVDASGQINPWLHRDIKPDNIIRRKSDNKSVLIDFGSAVHARRGAAGQTRQTTLTPGTEGYMSWHQATGQTDVTDDIFALAYTIMFLVTGVEPDPGDMNNNILPRQNRDQLINQLPPSWQQPFNFATQDLLLAQGQNGDVGLRFPSAQAFRGELVNLLSSAVRATLTPVAPPVPTPTPVTPPPPPISTPGVPLDIQFIPTTASMFTTHFYLQPISGFVRQSGTPVPGIKIVPIITDTGLSSAIGAKGTQVVTGTIGEFNLVANDVKVPISAVERRIDLSFVDSAGTVLDQKVVNIVRPATAQPPTLLQSVAGTINPFQRFRQWRLQRQINKAPMIQAKAAADLVKQQVKAQAYQAAQAAKLAKQQAKQAAAQAKAQAKQAAKLAKQQAKAKAQKQLQAARAKATARATTIPARARGGLIATLVFFLITLAGAWMQDKWPWTFNIWPHTLLLTFLSLFWSWLMVKRSIGRALRLTLLNPVTIIWVMGWLGYYLS